MRITWSLPVPGESADSGRGDIVRARSRAAARLELGLDDAPIVAFVGSFQPWRRLDLLLEAAAAIPGAARPCLLLVRDEPQRQTALDSASRLGLAERVLAPGALADALAHLAKDPELRGKMGEAARAAAAAWSWRAQALAKVLERVVGQTDSDRTDRNIPRTLTGGMSIPGAQEAL